MAKVLSSSGPTPIHTIPIERAPNTQQFQELCETFQKSLSEKMILLIWKAFREGGNLSEGKVNRYQFKRVMVKQIDILEGKTKDMDPLLDALFERFKLEKFGNDQSRDEEKIDIQDLVVSLTILAHMHTEMKLELIFQLTDVDEDGCLSIDDILQMIKRIERNFSKEQAFIVNSSSTLHYELSQRKAQRRFTWATQKLNKQVGDQKSDESGLIERKGFLESLKTKEKLFENFLPQNFLLSDVLLNTSLEKSYEIYDNNRIEFEGFRKDIHSALRSGYKDKYSQQYLQEQKGIRYPGKVEVVQRSQANQEKKFIDVLSNFEKHVDKKSMNRLSQGIGMNQKNDQKQDKKDPVNRISQGIGISQKNDQKQDKKDSSMKQEEVDNNNNLDIHRKRLKEMEERSKSWTLGFKSDKTIQKK